MQYLVISFSHKNSTLEIREKLSFSNDEELQSCLQKLNTNEAIHESMIISTCNRMEIVCSCSDTVEATKHIFEHLSNRTQINKDELEGLADIFDESSAIHHLFSVASSLDSMVVGETQIVGQLKDAFRFAYDNRYCGQKIAYAMKKAFACAAKVRNYTEISSKPVSMASVAVSKLKSILRNLEGKKALIIGVGEMSEITAKHLISAGADVFIMNRTLHKAKDLAQKTGANFLPFEQLAKAINEFEILFTATSASEPIITDAIIQPCDFERYWFDLAMPRDIVYSKGEKINLFVIDDLKIIIDENINFREDAARNAHSIVGRSVVEFFDSLQALDIEPFIKDIYLKAQEVAKIESQRAIKNHYIPKEYEAQAQKMCEQALKRFLHDFTKQLRESSDTPNILTLLKKD